MATIVVVDDQASAREMMRSLIKGIHESIEVVEFWDAVQAFDWCARHSPDLVLLDYRMPALDGITFAERLRATPSGEHTAIMMITSMGDVSIRLAALQAGIVEFLVKPIVPQELKLRVRNLLALSGTRPTVVPMPALPSSEGRGLALKVLGSMMADLRNHRESTQHSVVSVEAVVAAMADKLKLGVDDVAKAVSAARVYDIGMVLVPESSLNPERDLTTAEWTQVHCHVQRGRDLLAEVDAEIAEIAYRHHEHFNGSGYPDNLIGESIPAISRMLSVADVFCALISKRPQRAAYRISEAVNQISAQSGTTFDPACVEALVECLPVLLGKTESMPARPDALVGGQLR